jgi:hypothetical protein
MRCWWLIAAERASRLRLVSGFGEYADEVDPLVEGGRGEIVRGNEGEACK